MLPRKRMLLLLFVLLAVAGLLPAKAGITDDPPAEFGILAGAGIHDQPLNPAAEPGIGPLVGARLGYRIIPRLNWFADFTWSTFKPRFNLLPSNVDVSVGRSGLELLFWPKLDAPVQPFLEASGGMMDVNFSIDPSDYRPGLASVGLGVRGTIHHRWAVRVEFRGDHTLADKNAPILPYTNTQSSFRRAVQGERIGARVLNYQAFAGISVLFGGHAADSDGDGVPDKLDKCPDTPAGWQVDASGCPLDSDGDGVPDGADKCPATPKGAQVDAKGCPTDADGDGVPDGIDQCPDTPKGASVDAKGCPLDSDGDGVPDGIDQCPGTPAGTKVDEKGCPLPPPPPAPKPIFEEGKKSLILQGVNFQSGKAVLTPESLAALDKVAASLKEWPDVRIEVGGHTDNVGSDALNQKLSQARAQTVRDYLISKGVDGSRLTAKGYGPSKPIADNSTPEGRAQNRRVELTKID